MWSSCNKIIDIVNWQKAQVVFMTRWFGNILFGPYLHPFFSSLNSDANSWSWCSRYNFITSSRLTVSGATCTIALNSEFRGAKINQNLPIGWQRNFVIFSHYHSCYPWPFAASRHPYLEATVLMYHRTKSIALIPGNNRGFSPETNSFFFVSKTHASFSSSCDLFTQHWTCAQFEVEGGGCCTIFNFPFYVTFLYAPDPGWACKDWHGI